jgi:hypothetical protein
VLLRGTLLRLTRGIDFFCLDMHAVAREFSDALNGEVTYSDISPEDWEQQLKRAGLPEHLTRHQVTMSELHRAGRYDRQADGMER